MSLRKKLQSVPRRHQNVSKCATSPISRTAMLFKCKFQRPVLCFVVSYILLLRNNCDNSTSQTWNIFSGLTEVKLADPSLNFCIDAKTGECCLSVFKRSELRPDIICSCASWRSQPSRDLGVQRKPLAAMDIYWWWIAYARQQHQCVSCSASVLVDCYWNMLYIDLCLEVPNSSTKNGVQVHTSGCNGGLNQVWNLV